MRMTYSKNIINYFHNQAMKDKKIFIFAYPICFINLLEADENIYIFSILMILE